MARHLVLLLLLVLKPTAGMAADAVQAEITYWISSTGLESAAVTVKAEQLATETSAMVVLPFHCGRVIWDELEVVGTVNRKGYSIAIVNLSPKQPEVSFSLPLEANLAFPEGVRLLDRAVDSSLVVPTLDQKVRAEARELARSTGAIPVDSFGAVRARLEADFVVLNDDSEETILESRVVSLSQSDGEYRLEFRRPPSMMEDVAQNALGLITVAVLGLLLAFVAPGLLPEGPISTIVISAMVIAVVALVALRWWAVVGRSRQVVMGAIVDSAIAAIYLGALAIVWWYRRRAKRSPPPLDPEEPATQPGQQA